MFDLCLHQAEGTHTESLYKNPTLAKCLIDADYLLKSDLSEFSPKQRLHSHRNADHIDPTNEKKTLLSLLLPLQRDLQSHLSFSS